MWQEYCGHYMQLIFVHFFHAFASFSLQVNPVRSMVKHPSAQGRLKLILGALVALSSLLTFLFLNLGCYFLKSIPSNRQKNINYFLSLNWSKLYSVRVVKSVSYEFVGSNNSRKGDGGLNFIDDKMDLSRVPPVQPTLDISAFLLIKFDDTSTFRLLFKPSNP